MRHDCQSNEVHYFTVHCGPIRQTATIVEMSKECLRTGDKAICRFKFIKYPEYVRVGTRIVFREGRTKAVGTVTKVFPYVPAVQSNAKQNKKLMHGTLLAQSSTSTQITTEMPGQSANARRRVQQANKKQWKEKRPKEESPLATIAGTMTHNATTSET